MFPASHIAKVFEEKSFDRAGSSERDTGSDWVDDNKLIDLCLSFESAVKNLDRCLKETQWELEKLLDAVKKLDQLQNQTA